MKGKMHFDERYPTGLYRKQYKTIATNKNQQPHEFKRLDWVYSTARQTERSYHRAMRGANAVVGHSSIL